MALGRGLRGSRLLRSALIDRPSIASAQVATVSDDFATPFDLPDSWGATARQPYASAFNRLHGAPALVDGKPGDDNIQQAEKALHDSHDKLRALTGGASCRPIFLALEPKIFGERPGHHRGAPGCSRTASGPLLCC